VIQRALTHGVLGVAVMAVMAGGCSSALNEARISAARVEPELEPRSSRGAAGPVPIVIAAPRPYRTARGVAARAAAPRRLPATTADRAHGLRAEVEMALRDYGRDFNRHDIAAVASHWTTQGENLDLDTGETTSGRDAVRDVFASLFTADDDAAIDIDVQAIRPVRADVAVVDGSSTVRFGDGTRAGSRFSAVMVRQDGRWMLDSVRESDDPAAAHAGRPLEQLEWLVGAWEHTDPRTEVRTRCFWSAGRGFLVRAHAVSSLAAAGAAAAGIPALLPEAELADREVTEIIGWDPESQLIRSWVFTSAGRFAEGTWTPTSDGWRVRLEGRGSDMGRTYECVIARRGPDGVSVSGPRDGLAAALAPVCDVVRVGQ